MSEPTSTLELQIPVPPKISGAPRPPIALPLPLVCYPRRVLFVLYAIFAIAMAALGALAVFALGYALLIQRRWGALVFTLVAMVPMFVLFAGVGLYCVIDALRPGPSLSIDPEGFTDLRQHLRIRWEEVAAARVGYSKAGISQLVLRMGDGRARRRSPFRMGASTGRLRRGGDDVVAPLLFLRPSPAISAMVIAALLERSGVKVEGKPFWAQG